MLVVKKFGGSSVADKERIFNVAKRCIEEYEKGNQVVVVLSAMGKTTDGLIAKAHEINPNPPKREMDMLLATGEQISVALMAMAMNSLGVPSISLCVPGGHAHHFCPWDGQIKAHRYGTHKA